MVANAQCGPNVQAPDLTWEPAIDGHFLEWPNHHAIAT